jgi:putative peptide zinc metalloprotease protein
MPPAAARKSLSVSASSERAAAISSRPRLRADVEVWPLFEGGAGREATFIVGSREVNRFLTVPQGKLALVRQVLARLDGTRTVSEIEQGLAAAEGKRVDVAQLCRFLEENGLLAGAPASSIRKRHVERFSLKLFRLPVEGLFAALERLGLGWLTWLAWASVPIVALGGAVAFRDGLMSALFDRHVRSGMLPSGLGLSVALVLFSFACHELAHGVVALRYGVRPRQFEASLYLGFIPLFFLRIPGLYTLRRTERLKVWSAGIAWNVLFASACVLALQAAAIPSRARPAVLLAALANYSLALFNLVPFLPTDGYFLLSTALRRHNVRDHAMRELARWATGQEHRFSGLLVLHVVGLSASLAWVLSRNLAALRQGAWGSPGPWLSLLLLLVSWTLIFGPFFRHLRRPPERGEGPAEIARSKS